MNQEVTCRIKLIDPPVGVDYGLQKGSGAVYQTIQKQRSAGHALLFEEAITVFSKEDGRIDFKGPLVQGPRGSRFIYIDIGTAAGQAGSCWTRRLKIPLSVAEELFNEAAAKKEAILYTEVAGTAKDGGPNCATVKPFEGWRWINK